MVTSGWWMVVAVMVMVGSGSESRAYHVLEGGPEEGTDETSSLQDGPPSFIAPWIVKALRVLPRSAVSAAGDTYTYDSPAELLQAYRSAPPKRILGVELPDYIANNSRMKDLRQRMKSSG